MAESTAKNTDKSTIFNIIHFSDVYDICGDSNGGASGFLSVLDMFKEESLNPLIFFSGNFISQSDISCLTKGEHMISIMNQFGINGAILGNHDFDFGENNVYNIIQKLNFPIINTNILFESLPIPNNKPLIHKYLVINYNKNGTVDIENKQEKTDETNETDESQATQLQTEKGENTLKIGVIGVCENWLDLISNRLDNSQDIIYMDMIEMTQKYINKLREEYNVDMIIALTHSKLLNDNVLADKINGIDIILSGKDHVNTCLMTKHSRTFIVKSGYNFDFSWIQFIKPCRPHTQMHAQYNQKNNLFLQTSQSQNVMNGLKVCLLTETDIFKARKYWYKVRYYELNQSIKHNEEMKALTDEIVSQYNTKLNDTLGEIECNLDCTQFSLLNGECNSTNFATDIIRNSCQCDCVILSATSFLSSDDVLPDHDTLDDSDIKSDDTFNDAYDDHDFDMGTRTASNFNIDGTINKGEITYADVINKLFIDNAAIILLQLTGEQIRLSLEHGLSKCADGNGNELINGVNKFPHISGLRLVYDPIAKNGDKIKSIWINKYHDEQDKYFELKDEEIYSLVTSESLYLGGDGYKIFMDPVGIISDDKESINAHMILIDFFRKINELNNLKLLFKGNKIKNKKQINIKIKRLSLKYEKLLCASCSCIETKWVSSFQVLSGQNEDGKLSPTNDDVELEFNKSENEILNENETKNLLNDMKDDDYDDDDGSDIELGADKQEDKQNDEEEEEEEDEQDIDDDDSNKLLEKKHEKNKFQLNMDKEIMREKLNNIKKSSQIKLNLMGKKLKKLAVESQNEMEKLSEKTKHFINVNIKNENKEIKYDENGNILDVEIFIIKPKIDNRIMTIQQSESQDNSAVVNNYYDIDDQDKQRQKISDESNEDNPQEKRRPSKAKLLVSRSSQIFKKIEFKKIEFKKPKFNKKKSKTDVVTNDNNNDTDDNTNKKKKRFKFKGFRK